MTPDNSARDVADDVIFDKEIQKLAIREEDLEKVTEFFSRKLVRGTEIFTLKPLFS